MAFRRQEAVLHPLVVEPLGDLTRHVAVLVLHDAAHQGIARVEDVLDPLLGAAEVLADELVLREEDVLVRLRGREPS